jgi:inner membrane protein
MLGPTHALFGLTTLAAVQSLTEFVELHPVRQIPTGLVLCAGAAILGSLVPDLDAGDSAIKRELGPAGAVVSQGLRLVGVKHRGLTHRGLVAGLVLALSWGLGWRLDYPDLGLAFGLGYLSHLLADGLTRHGIPLLWPWPGQVHLLPRPLRVRTGGPGEVLIFILVALALAWLLPEIVSVDELNLFAGRW